VRAPHRRREAIEGSDSDRRAIAREPLSDRGALDPGMLADLQVWDLPSFEDLIYRLGNNAVAMVIKRGVVFRF
jgi:imidazolonepropionase-like amidohydrolase